MRLAAAALAAGRDGGLRRGRRLRRDHHAGTRPRRSGSRARLSRTAASCPCASRATARACRRRCAGARFRPRARDLALVVEDPDAPGAGFTHWVAWKLPFEPDGEGRVLEDNVAPEMDQAENDAGDPGWAPACPPGGRRAPPLRLHALRARPGDRPRRRRIRGRGSRRDRRGRRGRRPARGDVRRARAARRRLGGGGPGAARRRRQRPRPSAGAGGAAAAVEPHEQRAAAEHEQQQRPADQIAARPVVEQRRDLGADADDEDEQRDRADVDRPAPGGAEAVPDQERARARAGRRPTPGAAARRSGRVRRRRRWRRRPRRPVRRRPRGR